MKRLTASSNRMPLRLLQFTMLCIGIAMVLFRDVAAATEPVTQPARAADLTSIMGPDASSWTFLDKRGKVGKYTLGHIDGVSYLSSDVPTLVARSSMNVKIGQELTAIVQFDAFAGISSFKIVGAQAAPGVPGGISMTMTTAPDSDALRLIVKGPGPTDYLSQRTYKLRWLTSCRLGVPEDLRVRIEHLIAMLPPLGKKWIKVRWQLRGDGTRIYVDDRLLWQSATSTVGGFSMELSPAVRLASFQVAALEPSSAAFETIPLAGYLNANQLNGQKIKHESLSTTLELGGIPFRMPEVRAGENDHVDLKPSWLQNGTMSGRDSPRDGIFGGRWEGSWSVNPSRIQFAIPPGRYSAIHLLAAADSDPVAVPIVTAQFYALGAGRPIQVTCADVRRFNDPSGNGPRLPVVQENGAKGNLFLISIPIEPGSLACFGEQLELELTKEVRLYRAYPDPLYYSFHPAGLPSSVHVYAVTLERPKVNLDLQAANGLHVWASPDKPAYVANLTLPYVSNATSSNHPAHVKLSVSTISFDGKEKTSQVHDLDLQDGQNAPVKFELDVKQFGYHTLTVNVVLNGSTVLSEERGFALLHPDTREHGGWDRGKGPLFGFWNWHGGFETPAEPIPMTLMGMAGAQTDHGTSFDDKTTPATKEIARKYAIKSYKAFGAGDHYVTSAFSSDLQLLGLEKAKANFLAKLDSRYLKPGEFNRPLFLSFFPEPGIGLHTYGVPLSYDGRPESEDYAFSADEEKKFQLFLNGFVEGAKIVKEHYPDVKSLLPHGDPGFPPPFLRRSPEVRKLLDGITLDIPLFERLPEGQMNKVSLHRLYIGHEEFKKAGIVAPWQPMYEGPCLPTRPGSLSSTEHAALCIRDALILLAYGVDFQTGGFAAFDAGGFWGEQHYGGGLCNTLPLATPKPAYAAYATMTRQLNGRNFEKWLQTGSLSVYALQFRHYRDNSLLHVIWTIRGHRSVTVAVPADAHVAVYDSMDNRTDLSVKDGTVTFTIDQAPCYVSGLSDSATITLGAPDHSDASPAADALSLAEPDGTWSLSKDRDSDYEECAPAFVRRYPTAMSLNVVNAPARSSGHALAVHMEKPATDQRVMPFYSTLVPPKPLVIPGKASHLGIWVNASSDWGRIVYCLRDAKGQRWISIGPRGAWNNDDIHSWSYFNFDGWRYLRFELPACSPYDLYREAGSTWWGNYGGGDGIPYLPLSLEKIIVERRTHAMYVNDPQPTSGNDVLLGGIFAEYEKPQDRLPRAVELSRIRMPIPAGVPELDNPIKRFETSGAGSALEITNIVVPLHESDGTQCYVEFTTVPAASVYEIWASPYPDGRGAVKVASQVKASGVLVRGFLPDTDFYLFVIYVDGAKKASKPSKAYHINLKDTFSQK